MSKGENEMAQTTKRAKRVTPKRTAPAKADPGPSWQSETDDDGILWLRFDRAGQSANTLSAEMLNELDAHLAAIAESLPRGVVFISDKPNGFIAGADIREFTELEDAAAAHALVQRGQSVFDRIEALGVPTVAAIHGFCLGGGLELALACNYRVAADEPSTKLGLPEVRLGIHPGFGGTVRLPQIIGAPTALNLIVSGRTLSARAAHRIGLADHATPRRHLEEAARSLIRRQPPRSRPGRLAALATHRLVRPLVARFVRRRAEAAMRPDHYPAPFAVIDMWQRHGGDPRAMMAAEARSISELIVGETARNLIRVFFMKERLKGLAKPPAGKSKTRFARVHVVGGGATGGDIAAWCALRGLRVSVQDHSSEALARMTRRAHELFHTKLKTAREMQAAADRLMPDPRGDGLQSADVVIEAVFEDAADKQKLLKSIEPRLRKDALLATNTSSIPLEELAKALKRPSRLVGLHFFNPVSKMQLVEVVAGAKTSKTEAAKAAAFTGAIGRLPLPVRSGPGFVVNRVLMPYLLEAVILEEEGIAIETIDRAALDFGMPLGPIRLADAVGLDICLSVAENLAAAHGDEVPARLQKLVAAGHLGRKSGRGFYRYSGGQPQQGKRAAVPSAPADLGDRLMLRMLNEAVACVREGVVADADLADAGVVLGTGFAPFRGGPMHYIDAHGRDALRARLAALNARYGDRFAPDSGWEKPKQS